MNYVSVTDIATVYVVKVHHQDKQGPAEIALVSTIYDIRVISLEFYVSQSNDYSILCSKVYTEKKTSSALLAFVSCHVQICDLVVTRKIMRPKRIFTRFQCWVHKHFAEWFPGQICIIHVSVIMYIQTWIMYQSLTLQRCTLWKVITKINRVLLKLHSQCHGCWWLGDARSQDISSHDIDPVLREYSVSIPAETKTPIIRLRIFCMGTDMPTYARLLHVPIHPTSLENPALVLYGPL